LLQKNASCWSRLAKPIIVEDLTEDEAVNFLMSDTFMEQDVASSGGCAAATALPPEKVRWIVDQVGGRLLLLIEFKRAWLDGGDLEEIAEERKNREREDLLKVTPIIRVVDRPDMMIACRTELTSHSTFSQQG